MTTILSAGQTKRILDAIKLATLFCENEADQRGKEDSAYDTPAASVIETLDRARDDLEKASRETTDTAPMKTKPALKK